eukprot:5105379-Lingulodinium_polyedra.AAC.1
MRFPGQCAAPKQAAAIGRRQWRLVGTALEALEHVEQEAAVAAELRARHPPAGTTEPVPMQLD